MVFNPLAIILSGIFFLLGACIPKNSEQGTHILGDPSCGLEGSSQESSLKNDQKHCEIIKNDLVQKKRQVQLKILDQGDLEKLRSFANNKTIWKMFRGSEDTHSEEWVRAMIQGSQAQLTEWPTQVPFVLGVQLQGELIGLIGLLHPQKQGTMISGEIWYIMDPNFWGQGYMTYAAQIFLVAALVDGFGPQKWKVKEITAQTLTTNLASIRLLEKLHFKKSHLWLPHGDLEWALYQLKIETAYLKYARLKKNLNPPCASVESTTLH